MKLLKLASAGAFLAGAAHAKHDYEDWIPVLENYGFNFGEKSVTFESDSLPISAEKSYDGKYVSIESPFYSHSHIVTEEDSLWSMVIKDKAPGIWDQEMEMSKEQKLRMLKPKLTSLDKKCQKPENKNKKACIDYKKPPKYQDGYKYFDTFNYWLTTGDMENKTMNMEQLQRIDVNSDQAWTLVMKREAWQYYEYFGKNLFKVENVYSKNDDGQAVDYKSQAWKITSSCNLYGDWDIYGKNKLVSKEFDIDTDTATYNVAWTSNSKSMNYQNSGNTKFELENASACMQSWQNMQKLDPEYYGMDLSEYYKALATDKNCIKRVEVVGSNQVMSEDAEEEPMVFNYNVGIEWIWNSPFDFSISYWENEKRDMKPFLKLDLSNDYESIDILFCGENLFTIRPQETHEAIEYTITSLYKINFKQTRKWTYMWEYLKALDWEKEDTWQLLTWHILNHDYPLGKLEKMHRDVDDLIKSWYCGYSAADKLRGFGIYLSESSLNKMYGHFNEELQYEKLRSESMLELLIEIRPLMVVSDPENNYIKDNAWRVEAADMGFCDDRYGVLADDIKTLVEGVQDGSIYLELHYYKGKKSLKKMRKIMKILNIKEEEDIRDLSPEERFHILANLVDENLPEPEEIFKFQNELRKWEPKPLDNKQVEEIMYANCEDAFQRHEAYVYEKVVVIQNFIKSLKAQQIADTKKYLGWITADRSIFEGIVDEIFQRVEDKYNGIWDCEFNNVIGEVDERCEEILATESGDYWGI